MLKGTYGILQEYICVIIKSIDFKKGNLVIRSLLFNNSELILINGDKKMVSIPSIHIKI